MTLDLDKVNAATFEPFLGSSFHVRLGDQARSATLEEVKPYERTSPSGRENFSLIFRVVSSDVLPQAIYELTHETLGVFTLFLVPIGRDETRVLYEAVFN